MNKRTLIIFARLPRAGEVKTRLGRGIGMPKAKIVYEQMADHTFAIAEQLQSNGVDVLVCNTPGATETEVAQWVGRPFKFLEQKGETLGERMRHAFAHAFANGANETVIIGTDVPELNVVVLDDAFHRLSLHNVVLGPSTDGGYYLIGMKPPIKDLFDGISWSTRDVLSQTEERLRALQLTWSLLDELSDIDTEEDYQAYLKRREYKRISLRLLFWS